MTSRRMLVPGSAALLLVLVALSGCAREDYAKLGHVPYKTLLAHKDGFEPLVRARLDAGDVAGAFYAIEARRARRQAASLPRNAVGAPFVDPALRDLRGRMSFGASASAEIERGFVVGSRSIQLESPPFDADAAFWKGVRSAAQNQCHTFHLCHALLLLSDLVTN